MKNGQLQEGIVSLEHVSFTISRRRQDAAGKQTYNRTHYSIVNKVLQTVDDREHAITEDPSTKIPGSQTRKRKRSAKKFTQMSLFSEAT